MVERGHVTRMLTNRRLQLPPTFAEDEEWRRIGARRTRFLDPGVPSFGEPRTILVRGSIEEEHEADN